MQSASPPSRLHERWFRCNARLLARRKAAAAVGHALMVLIVCLASTSARGVEPLGPDGLRQKLTQLFDKHPVTQRTIVTAKVIDVASGEVLFDRGSKKLLTPASNLKIYATAAALDLLGPDYDQMTTRIVVRDESVYLIGGGAPMTERKDLKRWAAQLVDAMDERARGDPNAPTRVVNVVPAAWADLPDKGPGWMWDDEPDYYNMTITPLMVDFNTLEVKVQPVRLSPAKVNVSVTPAGAYPPVITDVRPVPASESEPVRDVRIDRRPFTDTIRVTGELGVDAQPERDRITMHDPDRWVASVFAEMLRDHGLPIQTAVVQIGAEDELLEAGDRDAFRRAYPSRPLRIALKHFNRVSENAVGEMLLLHLGTKFGDAERFGAGAGWPKGARVISDWLVEEARLPEGSFRLVDGSGLSRYNLISAESAIRLLQYMHEHQDRDVFADALPVYRVRLGDTGRWDGTPLQEFESRRVRAKSGGMSGVNTISGYIDTLDGRRLAFSFLTNGFIGSSAPSRDLRNKMWSALVQYRPNASTLSTDENAEPRRGHRAKPGAGAPR